MERLTICGCPHQADGSGYYRFYLPFEYLADYGDHRVLLPDPGAKFLPNHEQIKELDLIVGQRFMNAYGLEVWSGWKDKIPLVYEVDDDIFHPDSVSGLAHLYDEEVRETFRQCIAMSDLVTVSTEPLAEEMRKHNPNVAVLPNHINADVLHIERPHNDRLTVGWGGGMSHLGDWLTAADPVGEVLRAHPDVDMHFIGIDYSPMTKAPSTRYTPWRPQVWSYYRSIDFDIGIAPLADTTFNHSKSHIRALEYMALGIPVIATDCPSYRELVIDGVTGYLVNSTDEWSTRLGELIEDEAMRDEMGAKGREVAASWVMQRGWKLWRDAYEEVTQ